MKRSLQDSPKQTTRTRLSSREILDEVYDKMASQWARRMEAQQRRQLRKFRMTAPYVR